MRKQQKSHMSVISCFFYPVKGTAGRKTKMNNLIKIKIHSVLHIFPGSVTFLKNISKPFHTFPIWRLAIIKNQKKTIGYTF